MMKRKILIVLAVASVQFVCAQQNTTAAGGNATGSGGSVSFSLGEVDYITQTGSGGTANQGVQQPYEVFTTSGGEVKGIDLEVSIYPNPATQQLILTVSAQGPSVTSAQLYDAAGKLLFDKKITAPQTQFDLEPYASGTYYLTVIKSKDPVKQFKIVKTDR